MIWWEWPTLALECQYLYNTHDLAIRHTGDGETLEGFSFLQTMIVTWMTDPSSLGDFPNSIGVAQRSKCENMLFNLSSRKYWRPQNRMGHPNLVALGPAEAAAPIPGLQQLAPDSPQGIILEQMVGRYW